MKSSLETHCLASRKSCSNSEIQFHSRLDSIDLIHIQLACILACVVDLTVRFIGKKSISQKLNQQIDVQEKGAVPSWWSLK
jgi:hypothetical protein